MTVIVGLLAYSPVFVDTIMVSSFFPLHHCTVTQEFLIVWPYLSLVINALQFQGCVNVSINKCILKALFFGKLYKTFD